MPLFQRPNEEKTEPASPPIAPTARRRGSKRRASASAASPAGSGTSTGGASSTWIGKRAQIEGEIVSHDDVCVQGKLAGAVRSRGSVVVSEGGVVKADISARDVVVHGRVKGDVEATGKTEISATGSVTGGVSAGSVVIALGAEFEGVVRRRAPDAKPPAKGS